MAQYVSNIKLEEFYMDTLTGFTGKAASVAFYPHTPARVQLVSLGENGVVSEWFDEGQLETA